MLAFRLYKQYLGPSLFGLVIAAVNIVGMLPQFDGGYRLAINRRLLAGGSQAERRRLVEFAQALYSRGAVAAGVLGTAFLILYSLGPKIREAGQPFGFYLALGVLGALAVLSTAQTQLLVGLRQQRQLFILNAINSWLYLGTLWVLFRMGYVVWAFPIAQFVILAMPTFIAWRLARTELPGIRLLDFRWPTHFGSLFRQLWLDAAPAFVCQLVMLFLYGADVILAPQLLPEVAATEVVQAALLFTMLRRFLQSADESIWPRLAAKEKGATQTSGLLVRLNAVVYGVIMTVAAVTLPAFIGWYTKAPPPEALVIWLFAFRYIVTGLASQPAYFLYGHGRFGDIARHLGLEFIVAVALSFFLAPRFGAAGVAGAFALATLFGVAIPLLWSYARASGVPLVNYFLAVWARAIPGMAIAGLLASTLMQWATGWPATVAVGAAATLLSLGLFAALAWWRTPAAERWDARVVASHF